MYERDNKLKVKLKNIFYKTIFKLWGQWRANNKNISIATPNKYMATIMGGWDRVYGCMNSLGEDDAANAMVKEQKLKITGNWFISKLIMMTSE